MTKSLEMMILSLFYIAFVNVIFFSKKRINSSELNAFSRMMLFALLGQLFEIGCVVTIMHFGIDSIITILVNRIYLVVLATFQMLFCNFQLIVTISDEKHKKHRKAIITFNVIAAIIYTIVSMVLPLELVNSPKGIYSSGAAPQLMYLAGLLVEITVSIAMIRGLIKKETNFYKCLPFITFNLFSFVVVAIQNADHRFTLFSILETLVLVITYFTLENPDIKAVEQLKIAKNEAEKANNAKSAFLSSMSHEIRTPLNAIVGFAEDIRSRKSEASKAISDDADYIVNASNTLLEIVGNILDINKIETSGVEIIESPYDFKEKMNTLVRINSVRIEDKPVKLNVDIAEDIPDKLIGDEVHVKEVINNLLSNAIKYTEEGEVNVKVSCDNKGSSVVLYIVVSDTGKGIKQEDMGKLFSKFERLDTEINSTIEGTGLGLAITKSLVELMKGKIEVESEYKKGSTFRVTLPQKRVPISMERKEETSSQEENIVNKADNSKKTILVVDDNLLNIKVAERTLQAMGYNTKGANSGHAAINMIKLGNEFDLILMDIMMPEMDGVECFKKLQKLPDFNTRVVALTADAIAGAKEKYMAEGFNDYISKPFNKEDIDRIMKAFN